MSVFSNDKKKYQLAKIVVKYLFLVQYNMMTIRYGSCESYIPN